MCSTEEKETPEKQKGALRENVEAILVAIVLALFIRTFIVQAFKIPSGSMKQTLQIGDHILVNKFIYGVKIPFLGATLIPFKMPKRGDIIVFKFPEDPGKDFIKRVIAIGGDVIEGRDKKIYINSKLLNHDHGIHTDSRIYSRKIQPRDNFGPIRVPEDSFFVMGDNRDHSYDSRFWGFVDMKAVKGKAFMIYWSWDKENFEGGWNWLTWWNWVRWDRFGKILK
jgi:signal peptidase I